MDNTTPPLPVDNDIDNDITDDGDEENSAMSVVVSPPPFLPSIASANASINNNTSNSTSNNTRRYRPAPAKTFQCRGYGDCRMVFSRSEHLARHIRKHTGERPFSCHCGKQFSRLDNLRQHAQTVHADKQDQNDRMMHELTTLHASMTAASKGSAPRGKRAQAAAAAAAASATTQAPSIADGAHPVMSIKTDTMSMRPGTSTGYEGGNGVFHHPSTSHWAASSSVARTNSTSSTHSFRDQPSASSTTSSQSFRVPPRIEHNAQHPGQSFLAPASTPFSFSLPGIPDHPSSTRSRPGTGSSSRPPTASGTTLPPISAVVASSLAPSLAFSQPPPLLVPQQREQQQHQPGGLTSSHLLPLPNPTAAFARRPSTATRPGTAPASYYYGSSYAYPPGTLSAASNVVHPRPELSLSLATRRGHDYPPPPPSASSSLHGRDAGETSYYEPTSPVGGYDSPFFFHAPSTSSTTTSTSQTASHPANPRGSAPAPSSSPANPRKRPHAESDGDDDGERSLGGRDDDGNTSDSGERDRWYKYRGDVRPFSSSGYGGGGFRPGTATGGGSATAAGYEYGSESRPQSRRLSVMELCNDTDAESTARSLVPLSGAASTAAPSVSLSFGPGAGASRPTTSSGLVLGAQQLALDDRRSSPGTSFVSTRERAGGWLGLWGERDAVFTGSEEAARGPTAADTAVTAGAPPPSATARHSVSGGGGESLSPSPSPSSVYGRRGSVPFAYERDGSSGRSVSPSGGRYYEHVDGGTRGDEYESYGAPQPDRWRAAGAVGAYQQRASQSPRSPAPPSGAPSPVLSSPAVRGWGALAGGERAGYRWVRAPASSSPTPGGDRDVSASPRGQRRGSPGSPSASVGSGGSRGERRDDQVRAGVGMRVLG